MPNLTPYGQTKLIVREAVTILLAATNRSMPREDFDAAMLSAFPTADVIDMKNIVNDRAGIDNSGTVTKQPGRKEFYILGDSELITAQTICLASENIKFIGTHSYAPVA